MSSNHGKAENCSRFFTEHMTEVLGSIGPIIDFEVSFVYLGTEENGRMAALEVTVSYKTQLTIKQLSYSFFPYTCKNLPV